MGNVTVIDRGWNNIVKNVNDLHNSTVKVGFPADGIIEEPTSKGSGHEKYKNIPDVATIAFWLEFGTVNIKGWPFMRNGFNNVIPKLLSIRNGLYNKVVMGSLTAKQALSVFGEKAVAEIRKEIRNLKTPENKPSTIARKGSDNPLIDTGQMIQSVQYTIDLGKNAPLKTGIKIS